MIVKICGLTSLEDAMAACELGADMLGFNFYPSSPRYLQPAACTEIAPQIRKRFPSVTLVGVFVNSGANEILDILGVCRLDIAQLSGDEPPAVQLALRQRSYKALRPTTQYALQAALGIYPLRSQPPAFLIDAFCKGEYGGTGASADWSLASDLAAKLPIFLAGGLSHENVQAAIAQVHPWGVDTASGVESKPGTKDKLKIEKFIQAARNA